MFLTSDGEIGPRSRFVLCMVAKRSLDRRCRSHFAHPLTVAVAPPDAMLQASAQVLAHQQQQTIDIIAGLHQQVRDMMGRLKSDGKGSMGGEGFKGVPKPISLKGYQRIYVERKGIFFIAYVRGVVSCQKHDLVWHGPDYKANPSPRNILTSWSRTARAKPNTSPTPSTPIL